MKNIVAALMLTATTAACSSTHTTQVAGATVCCSTKAEDIIKVVDTVGELCYN